MKISKLSKKYFNNLTVKSKFIFAFTFLISLIAIVINIYLPKTFRSQAFDFLEAKTISEAKIISYNLSSALFFNDLDAIEESIEAAKLNKDIVYVVVTDNTNNIISAYNLEEAQNNDFLNISFNDENIKNELIYKIYSNIVYKENKIGKLYIAHSLIGISDRVYKMQVAIGAISLTVLVLVVFLVFGISSILTKPLNRIVRTTQYIANGDLSKRADVLHNDEVGKFALSFNLMVDKLETAYNDLKSEIDTRKKTEIELQSAKENLYKLLFKEKELNMLKSRFISMVSHEFRTPLTVIMNSSDIVKTLIQREAYQDALSYLAKIKLSVETLTNLLEDILVFGKTEQSELTAVSILFDPIELCKRVIEEIKIIDSGQHIFEFFSNEKSFKISSDRQLIRYIIVNLLGNFIKYSDNNTVIRLEFINNTEDFKIKVIDNGFGISEEDQKHLFKAFFRGEKNIGTIKGFGLGLNIVHRAVVALKGEISYESKLNEGTTFIISIPKN